MARIGERLREADGATAACAKPGCSTGSHMLHRHHRRHQAIWLGIWAKRRRGEKKFEEFVERYHSFAREDWTRICDMHHAEIHLIYDEIIRADRAMTGEPLSQYSWVQAEKLMDKLESAFFDWLKKETPGVTSENLNRIRERRRQREREQAIERLNRYYPQYDWWDEYE